MLPLLVEPMDDKGKKRKRKIYGGKKIAIYLEVRGDQEVVSRKPMKRNEDAKKE